MNRTEHLLTVLIEEAAEIQQAATKALRFGLKDGYPGGYTTNADDINKEFLQLLAVVEMIDGDGLLPHRAYSRRQIQDKKARVENYIEYAKTTGALSN